MFNPFKKTFAIIKVAQILRDLDEKHHFVVSSEDTEVLEYICDMAYHTDFSAKQIIEAVLDSYTCYLIEVESTL